MNKMIREKTLFLGILADHLNGRKTIVKDPNIDWNTIVRYARRHQISGIIYSQVKKYLPVEYAIALRHELLNSVYYQSNRNIDLNTIETAFKEESIPSFIIKGNPVANLYPVPMLRTMCDLDIVVHTEDREKCHEILLLHGFSCESKHEDREWQYYKNNMEYELHDRLVYKEAINKKGQAEFFNQCWKYVKNGELDWNFHLLFLLFHLCKHLMNAGVGFRQFIDIAVVVQKKQIDWDWLKEELKEIELWAFALKCFGLIERWFEIKTPIAETPDDSFYESATEAIFRNGIFGHDDKNIMITNEVRYKKLPHFKMIQIFLRTIFPSIKRLESLERYAYLKKCRLLLPFAWAHRWVWKIRNKNEASVINNFRDSFASSDAIKERIDILNQWGL